MAGWAAVHAGSAATLQPESFSATPSSARLKLQDRTLHHFLKAIFSEIHRMVPRGAAVAV